MGFWSFGFAFAYGKDDVRGMVTSANSIQSDTLSFIGSSSFFLQGYDDSYAFWLFQFAFAATSATIVAGSLAERSQMAAYMCYSFLLTGFVYPVVVHSFWSVEGFLNFSNSKAVLGIGCLDFAGAGVVHITGGLTALIAVIILGPRKGRFIDERTGEVLVNPSRVRGHSMSLQVLGAFILWFGWYGFNIGSTFSISSERSGKVASLAGVCTTLGGASGCVTSLLFSTYKNEKRTGEMTFELVYALNGMLSGLVSITGACAYVEPWAAVVIGGIAGFVYCFTSSLLVKYHIDDAVDAVPVHLCNGIWGLLCIGIFAAPDRLEGVFGDTFPSDKAGLLYQWTSMGTSDGTLLAAEIIGVIFILGWVLLIMVPFFLLLSYVGWLRSDPLEEIVGLDISYHGRSAYNIDVWDATEDMTGTKGGLSLDEECAGGGGTTNYPSSDIVEYEYFDKEATNYDHDQYNSNDNNGNHEDIAVINQLHHRHYQHEETPVNDDIYNDEEEHNCYNSDDNHKQQQHQQIDEINIEIDDDYHQGPASGEKKGDILREIWN